jgi:hypothetical protein
LSLRDLAFPRALRRLFDEFLVKLLSAGFVLHEPLRRVPAALREPGSPKRGQTTEG